MKKFAFIFLLCLWSVGLQAHPVKDMLERIEKGASKKFVLEMTDSGKGFFELDRHKDKVVVRADSYVNMAAGVGWYLKYYAGVHLSWNCMTADLPDVLPPVTRKERHETDLPYRYYLNYCTYSYSMAFWDWERWEKEIDWMALHGVNMPLMIIGADVVWFNVLSRLGYTREEADRFIAGPAFQAWWLMNNLEGWGGPNPDSWYESRFDLQKKIISRLREYGMEPVLPGYSGMLPHDARERLGLDVADPGYWNGFHRPAFLQPNNEGFSSIAEIYYEELEKIFGKAKFYSMDPFHEGGSVDGVDLPAVGHAIWTAMKKANPDAVWVAQAWGNCPYDAMIKDIPAGDMLILDLYSESRPQWGDPESSWYRKEGFRQHSWLYCMLLNFGANIGLHGKMDHVIDEFYKARSLFPFANTLAGVGMTMEGIENNPVMYELFSELPWRKEKFAKEEWIEGYLRARYGKSDPSVSEAWRLLSNSIYNAPASSTQQGTHESIFCARPGMDVYQVSSWSEMQDYYRPEDVMTAAGYMVKAAGNFRGNNNFEYDLVDIVRQAVAEKGRQVYHEIQQAYLEHDIRQFQEASDCFLDLICQQDRLLATRPEFKVGTWIEAARSMGYTSAEKDWYEWNARVQITVWGGHAAAENGGLRDYAHKEWSGLLQDLYYKRWECYFDNMLAGMTGEGNAEEIDFYSMDEAWTLQHEEYPSQAEGDPVAVAEAVYEYCMSVPYGEIQKERRTVLAAPSSGCLIMPDSSFSARVCMIRSDMPVRRMVRVVGGTVLSEPFSARGETLFREAEYLIDDSLDSLVTENEHFSLYFKGECDSFERLAFYRLTEPVTGNFTAVLPIVRKKGLETAREGFFGLEMEVFYRKDGRALPEIYDRPDTVLFLPVPDGTDLSFKEVSEEFNLAGHQVACILLKAGGMAFKGECWIESPYFVQNGMRTVNIPFHEMDAINGRSDYWAGCNLSTRSWPRWRLSFGGKTCFEGNVFDRASNVADFYIPVPEWAEGEGEFELTLVKEPHRAAFPYRLKSFELLEEPARDFEVVSVPRYVSKGENASILVETNRPDVSLAVSCSDGSILSPAVQTLVFEEPGLHAVRLYASDCGTDVHIALSDGVREVNVSVRQVVEHGYDYVYLSSGDEIYVDKQQPLYDYFFKWYVSARIGNWYQFRPSYQWSGFRIWTPEFVNRYKELLCGLGMPYAWQVEGRTLAGSRLNPDLNTLSSPMFRGKQAHENDGGYNYWRHFLYEGLYSDLAARARPYGGIFARHRPIYTSNGVFIHYNPYKVRDMADGAAYLVDNLRYSKGESTRHTGPSTLFRYLYQAGYEWLGAEQMYGPEELVMSSLRGASRAYSRSFYGSLHAMQWGSGSFTDPAHALRHYMSLAVAYMHGSSHINTEEALWTDEYANDRYSLSGRQHRFGQNRMLDFIQTHTRRGEQVSRIAVVQGRNDAWNVCNRGSLWSQNGEKWKFNKASESFDLLKVFYPDHKLDWCGPDNMFSHTPYGTVDLVPVEAPCDVWKKYRVVVFLGWNTYKEADFVRLREFVRDGGTLVLGAVHLNSELQPDLPVRFPENDNLLKEMLGSDYRNYEGKKILKYGDGTIIYFASKCYPADDRLRKDYESELLSLASRQLDRDLPGGWIKTAEGVTYTMWEHDGMRTFYLLDSDWKDHEASTAVWSCCGYDFNVPVRPYFLETIHQRETLAVMPSSNTTDVLTMARSVASASSCQNGWKVTVQTTGPDVLHIMDGSTGKMHEMQIKAAGIHNIAVVGDSVTLL